MTDIQKDAFYPQVLCLHGYFESFKGGGKKIGKMLLLPIIHIVGISKLYHFNILQQKSSTEEGISGSFSN